MNAVCCTVSLHNFTIQATSDVAELYSVLSAEMVLPSAAICILVHAINLSCLSASASSKSIISDMSCSWGRTFIWVFDRLLDMFLLIYRYKYPILVELMLHRSFQLQIQ